MSKIVICGDLEWEDSSFILKYLKQMIDKNNDCIYIGQSKVGAEAMVNFYGRLLGIEVQFFFDYDDLMYNQLSVLAYIINSCQPEKLIIFHNRIGKLTNLCDYINYLSKNGNIEILIISNRCQK